ncbi:MAG: FecR family protein [Bacteroidetes bacterium]|nr:FecR family protein [Bacteroidota bacterium]
MTVDRIWYILGKKLTKEASKEELQELEQLLIYHPELQYPIQNIIELWNLDIKTNRQEAMQALQRHLLRIADQEGEIVSRNEEVPLTKIPKAEENILSIRQGQIFQRKFVRMAIYAGAACLIVTALLLHQHKAAFTTSTIATHTVSKQDALSEISTKPGSHSNIVLPDGSHVVLNGNSTLTYDKYFDKEFREVQLNGEAYFDVTKNPDRPFIIHTQQMDIKVLGTAFNVKSYSNDNRSETSLIRGSIEITLKSDPLKKIKLKPTDKLIIDKNLATLTGTFHSPAVADLGVHLKKINYLPADNTIIETSWVDDRLIFRDTPFAEIALEMERRFGISILFKSETAKQFRFDGNFKNETVEQVLNALQLANHFSYQKLNNTIIITN